MPWSRPTKTGIASAPRKPSARRSLRSGAGVACAVWVSAAPPLGDAAVLPVPALLDEEPASTPALGAAPPGAPQASARAAALRTRTASLIRMAATSRALRLLYAPLAGRSSAPRDW